MTFQSADVASIAIAFISLSGICFTAWMTYITKRDTREINRSVNHIRPGEKRLYELAVESSVQLVQIGERVSRLESKVEALNPTARHPLAVKPSEILLFPLDIS